MMQSADPSPVGPGPSTPPATFDSAPLSQSTLPTAELEPDNSAQRFQSQTAMLALIDLLNLGLKHQQEGAFLNAVKIYHLVHSKSPQEHPIQGRCLFLLGTIAFQRQSLETALEHFREAQRIDPRQAAYFRHAGTTLNALGRHGDALEMYQRALAIDPAHDETLELLARTLNASGSHHEAALKYNELIQKLGPLEREAGGPRRQRCAHLHAQLGLSLHHLGRFSAAVQAYDRAVMFAPDHASAYASRGVALSALQRPLEALASYDRAIALQPEVPETHYNRGNLLTGLNRLEEAEISFREALRLRPNYLPARSNLIFSLNYRSRLSPLEALEEARKYGEIVRKSATERFHTWPHSALERLAHSDGDPRLRVGFVSGDLRQHPVGYFLESILRNINPERFALHAYPTDDIEDELSARIKPYFARWIPLSRHSDADAATMIHREGVDILIDLAGHSARNRLPLFSFKPAPVQCTWLGYFSTTGLEEVDYIIADPWVVPENERNYYAETVAYMPESYLCFTPPDVLVAPGPLPALENRYITFACFNNVAKLASPVLALWGRILRALPESRLHLKAVQLDDPQLVANLANAFESRGVGRERLIIEGRSSREEYLRCYQQVDFGLDPFPWPGGTTTAEALWMGIPFLTMRGDRFSSRNGASIATNAGLSDWIAQNEDDYFAKALGFASDLPALAALRSRLRTQVLCSPLFDAPRFARHFEQLLERIKATAHTARIHRQPEDPQANEDESR